MNNSKIGKLLKNYFPKLSKEIAFVMLGQVIAALGSLFGVRLLTGKVTPAVYGEISLGLTIGVLFQQLLFGPLSNSYLRFFSIADEKNEITHFIKAVKKSSFQATLISLALIICIIIAFLLKGYSKLVGLILLSFLFMLISSYNTFLDNLQNAARQRIIVAWHQGIGSWLKYLVAIALIVILGSTSSIAMAGFLLSSIIVFGSQVYFFNRSKYFRQNEIEKIEEQKNDQWVKAFWNYAFPSILWGIFTWAQLSSDRWALGLFTSTSVVGLYTAVYQIGYYPISFFSGIIFQFVLPIVFKLSGDASQEARMEKSSRAIKIIVIGSLLFGVCAFAITFLFHKELFSIFVASNYLRVSYLLPYMVLAGSLFSSGQFASIYFYNEIKPKKLICIKIFSSLIGLIFNFVFVGIWGLDGIVVSIVIYSVIYFLMVIFAVPQKIHNNDRKS